MHWHFDLQSHWTPMVEMTPRLKVEINHLIAYIWRSIAIDSLRSFDLNLIGQPPRGFHVRWIVAVLEIPMPRHVTDIVPLRSWNRCATRSNNLGKFEKKTGAHFNSRSVKPHWPGALTKMHFLSERIKINIGFECSLQTMVQQSNKPTLISFKTIPRLPRTSPQRSIGTNKYISIICWNHKRAYIDPFSQTLGSPLNGFSACLRNLFSRVQVVFERMGGEGDEASCGFSGMTDVGWASAGFSKVS